MDFAVKDDTVALDIDYFDTLGLGFVSKSAFRIGRMAATADQHLIYDRTTGGLFYDADGNGAAAQVKILQIGKDLALTAHDFALFDTFVK
jgi:Ca2+-binding RTX toxin-like protein